MDFSQKTKPKLDWRLMGKEWNRWRDSGTPAVTASGLRSGIIDEGQSTSVCLTRGPWEIDTTGHFTTLISKRLNVPLMNNRNGGQRFIAKSGRCCDCQQAEERDQF